ncbi:MAG TPA: TetR/AcrR family transcriptional regulator [Streptosporangiaceae bacterium]
MPKVSERYRDARREQIMDAARRCFLRNGFRETSMTDLFAESGLSSGGFYRYFAGKDELIFAIAEETYRDIVTVIRTVAQEAEGSLGDALGDAIDLADAKHAEKGLGGIAAQVWAEALRNPQLAAKFTGLLDELRDEIAAMVRQHQEAGTLPPGVSAEALSTILVGIVPGYMLQVALLGPSAAAGVSDALRALWPNPSSDVAGAA